MAWTVYEPRGPMANRLQRGQAALIKGGELRLHASDVAAAGISGDDPVRCVLEFDAATRRVAIRAPREGEPTLVLRGEPRGGSRRRLSIAGLIHQLGIDPEELASRLRVEIEPGRLIVRLGGPVAARPAEAPAPAAEPAPTTATNPIAQRAAKRAQPIGRARPLKETSQP